MSTTFGVHALVFVGGTSPTEVRLAVREARQAGYDLLELSLHDAAALDVGAARAELLASGLGVTCSRGLSFTADLSSEDPDVVDRGVALLHASLQTTHGLGATMLTGALYSALGKYSRPLGPAGRANVVSALRDVASEAAALGLRLGLEVCNRYETHVVNTAADALRLADNIGADNVLIHLDTYHMNIEEADMVSPVIEVGDRLGYVHVGENHRGYLGSGHIDLPSFFRALATVGYTGPVTFESFSSAVVSPTLSNDLAVWRNLWDDGPALAAHARSVMGDLVEASRAR